MLVQQKFSDTCGRREGIQLVYQQLNNGFKTSMHTASNDLSDIIRFNCYQLKRFINSKANVYSFCSYGSAILILSRFVTREFISPVKLYIRVLSCIIYQLSEIFSTKVSTFTSSYTSK